MLICEVTVPAFHETLVSQGIDSSLSPVVTMLSPLVTTLSPLWQRCHHCDNVGTNNVWWWQCCHRKNTCYKWSKIAYNWAKNKFLVFFKKVTTVTTLSHCLSKKWQLLSLHWIFNIWVLNNHYHARKILISTFFLRWQGLYLSCHLDIPSNNGPYANWTKPKNCKFSLI